MNRDLFKTTRPVAKLRQGRTDWFKIENVSSDPNITAVYIYDEIGYFGVTAQDFVNELNKVKTPIIEVHLNTPGGDVFDGQAIYNALLQHPAQVNVIIDSLAASAGSFIAMAGDSVQIARNAQIMIHNASGVCIGDEEDMQKMADLLRKMSENIADIYAQKTGTPIEHWLTAMATETWYSSSEAVEAGLADSVLSTGKEDESVAATFDLSVFAYAGREQAPEPVIEKVEQEFDFPFDPEEFRRAFEEAEA
jgi:ATP-dependent Clp endopeptidase proteolytic subunit ClpP